MNPKKMNDNLTYYQRKIGNKYLTITFKGFRRNHLMSFTVEIFKGDLWELNTIYKSEILSKNTNNVINFSKKHLLCKKW